MSAPHDKAGYDGPDALMAAVTGEAPPREARADDAFMAEYRSAATDVALLREQLGLIGQALAEPREEPGAETGARSEPGFGTGARKEPGSKSGVRKEPGSGTGAHEQPSSESGARKEPGSGTGAREQPGSGTGARKDPGSRPDGASVTPLSARRRRPEPLAVALKGFVAAVGASLVIGMGWLVVHSGDMGAADDRGGSAASDSSADRPHTEGDAKLGHAGYLACARLVVEGTVAEVEPVPGAGQDRITLDVTRYYKPDKGRARITFPLETGAEPSLRAGDHMLVGISGGQAQPDMWATEEKEIARDRAWITEALPASRTFPCR
ncbi:hypothetical protein [Streptomyces indiaensis]|uniref:Uncharacterized protein n=1 Tax=Streptomyces indiaensis TaxID=284033 RepID=A0ABP6HBW1_9ACTN|nr:hypothetical protein [Streptomyces indiaensis]MCF1647420.1 hypothetical protein [Streptomyces indiaensis]